MKKNPAAFSTRLRSIRFSAYFVHRTKFSSDCLSSHSSSGYKLFAQMSSKLLAIVITVVLSWLVIVHPSAAARSGDSSSNGNRRFYARPMFPSRYSPIDMIAEDEDAMELNKRQLTDDYGHMRFGKRDQFDDYGHMRFGRNHD